MYRMHSENKITLVLQALSSWLVSYIAGLPQTAGVLFFLVSIDFATGLTAAWMEDRSKISGHRALRGLATKVGYFVAVLVAHVIGQPLGLGGDLGAAIAFFLCCVEGRSVFINLNRIGVPLPPGLIDILGSRAKGALPQEPPKN